MASAREQTSWIMMVHGEGHRRRGEFAPMQVMFMSFATPFFLVPVDVEEYGTGSSYLRGHEPRYDEEEAEAIAVRE